MKKQDLNIHFNEMIEKEADKFINELPLNGNIIEAIKSLLRVVF